MDLRTTATSPAQTPLILLQVTISTFCNNRNPFPEDVVAWIDYNNDGVFNNTNELVFNSTGLTNHFGVVYAYICYAEYAVAHENYLRSTSSTITTPV